MKVKDAIKLISAARERGDYYAGNFVDSAAAELAKHGNESPQTLRSLAYDALKEIDKGTSLLDKIVVS